MERLHRFPQPLPDESLYSLAVRYHRLSANDSYRQTSQELFGAYSRTCGSILPCCLDALSRRLASAYSVDELIDRHTLLPLYEPFLSDAKYSVARTAMAGSYGTGLKMSLGITASGFLKYASFRFCETCVQQDAENYGTAYWHRAHQALGSCTCPLHGEVLLGMAFPDRADWRRMLLPAEAAGSPVIEPSGSAAAGTVGEMQFWGLEHPAEVKDLLTGDFLKHRLAELGFLKSERLREQALRDFLTSRLLCGPRTNEFLEIGCSCDWVFRVLRPRGRVVQPLKFYFLCWLLTVDLEQLKSFEFKMDTHSRKVLKVQDSSTAADLDEIEAHRARFASSSNMKCHEKDGYHWLYRHDKEWLTQYVADHPFIRPKTCVVDWEARDQALAIELLTARDLILSAQGKPQKITRLALKRRVAHSHDFLRSPDKFPISYQLICDMLESDHDHQIRKIKWAVKNFLLPERSAISVVYKYSGIRLSHVTENEVFDILSTA